MELTKVITFELKATFRVEANGAICYRFSSWILLVVIEFSSYSFGTIKSGTMVKILEIEVFSKLKYLVIRMDNFLSRVHIVMKPLGTE